MTTSIDFARKHRNKNVIFIVEDRKQNPTKNNISKLKEKKPCSPLEIIPDPRDFLDQGIYIINPY